MQDFEKLGAFYLGKEYDLATSQVTSDLLLYDAKDLTTHAVCVGMTGSGKTGLCLALLEEALIDGIPAIAIDPKGDLGNLLLAFPDLDPANFAPWVDPGEAARLGLSVEELAAQTAETWKKGLAEWGQTPERIARFKSSGEVSIYTPGASAGIPLTILRSLDAPPPSTRDDADSLRQRITSAVSGLLGLMGVDADPLQDREHILLSNIVHHAWQAGRNLDMAALIREIQSPPFDKLGVMDLESIFPAKERYTFALKLNNLLASPGFAAWTQGEPLEVQRLLYTPEGKPRLAIISIAHLGDAERMFFVTLLLNEVLAWTRTQAGTSSLRAILYMDEVFGYFPPTANPPSKTPMLTLLKQARAFGLGVMLATQNPVDLDYKGLSNAGTWFLGRLQTERDKLRVLDGLEGAAASTGQKFDRATIDRMLSGLGKRVFLLNNVHEPEPVLFQTRWVLSYLRGPLTRDQIALVMAEQKQNRSPTGEMMRGGSGGDASSATGTSASHSEAGAATGSITGSSASAGATGGAAAASRSTAGTRPILPPDVPELFWPLTETQLPASVVAQTADQRYRPVIVGAARVHFAKANVKVDVWAPRLVQMQVTAEMLETSWDGSAIDERDELEWLREPPLAVGYESLPSICAQAKTYSKLATSLKDFLYRTQTLTLWRSPQLKLVSLPGEKEGEFRARLLHGSHEARDAEIEKLRGKYEPKVRKLEDKLVRAEAKLGKEESQASKVLTESTLSIGISILGSLFGRKRSATTGLGRTAGKIAGERSDIARATAERDKALAERQALEAEIADKVAALRSGHDLAFEPLETIEIKAKKSDIGVSRVALVWRLG